MKKFFFVFMLLATTVMMGGCTQPVPPGYIGKIIGTNGVEPEIYETGRVTILPFTRDRLVLLETATTLRPAPVKVIMADHYIDESNQAAQRLGLEMDFVVNIRYRLRADDKIVTAMLKDMKLASGVNEIAVMEIYNKYGNMVVGRVAREVLGSYTPETVLENLEGINKTLEFKIKESLSDSPLLVASVSLGQISMPKVITDRININKDTELSEVSRRAQQKIDLLNAQNEIELAQQQAIREEVDARSLANQNAILKASITPEVLELRRLQLEDKRIQMQREVLSQGLAKGNSSIFIPYGAVENQGAQVRMFQK
jgi:hypothetical protein